MEYKMGSDQKFIITINPTPLQKKPKKDTSETNRLVYGIKTVTGVTISEFSKIVSAPLSYAWFGGTLKGMASNENWLSSTVFALDFDKSPESPEQVIKKLTTAEVPPTMWYTTFSHTQAKPRYRLVFFVDEPVSDPIHRQIISDGLLSMVSDPDTTCSNAGRIYFGGIESHILNQNPIPTQKLLDIASISLITKDRGRNRKIPPSLFITDVSSGEKRNILYNNYRNYRISPKPDNHQPTSQEGVKIDWQSARNNVKVLDRFLSGEWLYHDQLFGLATNMIQVKGGRRLMKETMTKYNELGLTHYTENNFNILKYLNRVTYPPLPIHSFSPYPENGDIYDLIDAATERRGKIEVITTAPKLTLHQAELEFKQMFNEAMNTTNDNSIYLFALPTAIGKTEMITNVTATIALPTNALKNEVAERMKVDYTISPNPIKFENKQLNRKIEYFYNIGLPKKSTALLYKVINPSNSHLYSVSDVNSAIQYLEELQTSYTSNKPVLTSHARALHSEYSHETIIFDEDPLHQIIDIKSVEITDLFKLKLATDSVFGGFNEFLDGLVTLKPGLVYRTPSFSFKVEELIEKTSFSSIQSNVFDLFGSSYLYKDPMDLNTIHYVTERKLPSDKKVIILSATLPVQIYQRLYGNRLKVLDIRNVQQQGKILQYTKHSCSRSGLGRYYSRISQEIGEKPVITFKGFQDKFKNPVWEMYFGNCSGYDQMRGQDLVVVGTPHRNNVEYFLTAAVLGKSYEEHELTMKYQYAEYHGFRFKFNCFDDSILREIQLSLIESDLIQAVGRARTLRTNATVELYSNFPLTQSDQFIY
jgi:hypothetical protein